MNAGTIIGVVGAIIKDGGRYLVGQRAAHKTQSGQREFMGVKIEPGETPEEMRTMSFCPVDVELMCKIFSF